MIAATERARQRLWHYIEPANLDGLDALEREILSNDIQEVLNTRAPIDWALMLVIAALLSFWGAAVGISTGLYVTGHLS